MRRLRPPSLALSGAALLLVGCTVESPQAPDFESEWRIPLGTVVKTVEELIAGDDAFVVGADGSLSVQAEGQIDAVSLGDRLDVTIAGLSMDAEIGPIDLDPAAQVDFDYRLDQLYPPAAILDGQSVVVPAFTFASSSPPQDLPGFRSAVLETGGLRVTLSNGLPVPIGGVADPERVHLDLIDPVDGSVLASLDVPDAVAPGANYVDTIDLAGRSLGDSVRVDLRGGSPGSGGEAVTVDASASLAVRVETLPMRVLVAEAEIGAQSFSDTSTVALGDSLLVADADIASGVLQIDLRNDLPVPADARLSIPALRTPAGDAFALTIPLPAGAAASRSVDLRDHRLDFGIEVSDTLRIVSTLDSPGSGGDPVSIRSTDGVSVDIAPLALRFARVRGIVDPIDVALARSTATLDLPDQLDDLRLARAELVLAIQTSLGLPGTVDLRLRGFDAGDVPYPLDVHVDLPAAPEGSSLLHEVRLDETNSDLLGFLDHLPVRIEIDGDARVGDGTSLGSVAVDDSVAARWSIAAPMTVQLLAQSIEVDPQSLDLDADLRRQLDERLVGLDLEAEVRSTLPVAATAWLSLDPDSTRVRVKPSLMLGPIEIPASIRERGDGTRELAISRSSLRVEETEVPTITGPRTWQFVRVDLAGTGGNTVTLRATDRIEFSGFLRARLRVGDIR